MQWVKREIDSHLVRSTAQRWNFSLLLAAILNRRTISDSEDELYYFVKRAVDEQHNPFLLCDMLLAIQRVEQAWKKKEQILIFGDRDADGVTATAVLVTGLHELGLVCEWRVPADNEQYGLSCAAVERCVEKGVSLIITVDCGISNHTEIALAKQHGIDVIVLDHHNLSDTLPPAFAVVNPKRDDCRYPYPSISGCMVAYKFILAAQCYASAYGAFASRADNDNTETDSVVDPDLLLRLYPKFIAQKDSAGDKGFYELLLLAAVSTIADMMPLLNENRIIVNHGLRHIFDCKNEGMHALLRKRELAATDITARALAFSVIPLLNAAGRFGQADLSVRLLLTADAREAGGLANQMIVIHKHQKDILQDAWRTYHAQARKSYDALNGHCVVVSGDTIPNTVTGLFANKLQREFDATVVVVARNSQKISGSIRCAGEWKATDLARDFSEFFSNWGGHDRAAGFTVLPDRYDHFMKHLWKHFQQRSKAEKPARTIQIDAEVPRSFLTDALFEDNDVLEPFGQAFPLITYYTPEVVIDSIDLLGKDERHAKLLLNTGVARMPAIFWNCSQHLGTILRANNTIDIVYHVEYNYFRHNKEKRLSIIDVAQSGERSV